MWTPRAGSACSVARQGVRPASRVEATGIALPVGLRNQKLGICCYSSSKQGGRDRESGGEQSGDGWRWFGYQGLRGFTTAASYVASTRNYITLQETHTMK
jgi:hypothetical protein